MGEIFTPPEGLRRDQVLAYIIERIVRSGTSPSTPEIARNFSMSETRAKQLVAQLIERGDVEKTPGGVRSLRVRDVSHSRNLVEDALRKLGWTTAEPMGGLVSPFPNGQLPTLPPFEHIPDDN